MSSNETASIRTSAITSRLAWVWTIVFVVGLGLWLFMGLAGDPHRAWRAFLINFLFFTPLAGGMVVCSAMVILARGRWAGQAVVRSSLAGISFAPVSLIAFFVLWAARSNWALWIHQKDLPQGFWLNPTFVFIRDGAGLIIFWLLAWWFVRRRIVHRDRRIGGWMAFAYSIAFSLIGYDMVMALDPRWYSALFGAYFFISGMYMAVAAWTFLAVLQGPDPDQLQDLGKLIVTFSLITTYMMFSQLLPIWYENLPHEIRFVIPRMNYPHWRAVSTVLLATIYLGPLVWLLPRWWKRIPRYLGLAALTVLVFMWIERWWEVAPTAPDFRERFQFGLTELSITAAFLAAFAFGLTWYHRRMAGVTIAEADRP